MRRARRVCHGRANSRDSRAGAGSPDRSRHRAWPGRTGCEPPKSKRRTKAEAVIFGIGVDGGSCATLEKTMEELENVCTNHLEAPYRTWRPDHEKQFAGKR